jgi:hypothetical protein
VSHTHEHLVYESAAPPDAPTPASRPPPSGGYIPGLAPAVVGIVLFGLAGIIATVRAWSIFSVAAPLVPRLNDAHALRFVRPWRTQTTRAMAASS